MYRTNLDAKDKSGALLAVAAVHALLLLMLLQISGRVDFTDPQKITQVFDVSQTLPPPEEETVVEPQQQQQQDQPERPPEQEGAPSPENIRSTATPVVAPRPPISLPVPVPMATTETPNEGADPTQGASDRAGPGTGAGGAGTGTGSGGSGSGPGGGGGGGGGVAVSPALVRGITQRDYPAAIQRRWPRGGRIFLRLRVEPSGRASQCDVMRGFGDPVADEWTCRLIVERGQFRPARNANGEPVSAWFGYIQAETRR